MGFDQPVHWVVLLILAGLLFGGYKKLPEMARSAGRSMRVFKTELKGMADDDQARANVTTYPQQPGAPGQPGAAVPFPPVAAAPAWPPAAPAHQPPVPNLVEPAAQYPAPAVPVAPMTVPGASATAPVPASDPTAPPSA